MMWLIHDDSFWHKAKRPALSNGASAGVMSRMMSLQSGSANSLRLPLAQVTVNRIRQPCHQR